MKKYLVSLGASIGAFLVTTSSAHAQGGVARGYLQQVGDSTQLGSQGLPELIGAILNTVLSVLGIVLLVIVIYAGFLWMTAGGDPEKVKKAKDLIINATIGLLLILSALAISNFIFDELTRATTSSP